MVSGLDFPGIVCVQSLVFIWDTVGYGLKVDRYNCTFPSFCEPNIAEGDVCIDTGKGDPDTYYYREWRCASTSTKPPLLSDGNDTTYYIWVIPAFLNLAIPNNVCVGAIVMTFSDDSVRGTPSLTFELTETVTISHDISQDVRPGNLVNTTITFTPQYCGQSVRINIDIDERNAIWLTEVTLIEGGGSGSGKYIVLTILDGMDMFVLFLIVSNRNNSSKNNNNINDNNNR